MAVSYTGTYGDELPEGAEVRGEVSRSQYEEDPTLFDGLGSMVAYLARERAQREAGDDESPADES